MALSNFCRKNPKPSIHGYIFLLLASSSLALEIVLKGPDSGTLGDFEKFTCDLEGDDVTEKTVIVWKYLLKNGQFSEIKDSDMLTSLQVRRFSDKRLEVESFVKLGTEDIQGIVCEQSTNNAAEKHIEIRSLTPVTTDEDPCNKAEESGKPLTILYMSSFDILTPYRKPHYIDEKEVMMTFPTEVSQAKVICLSAGDNMPEWSMKKEIASKMSFATYSQDSPTSRKCKINVLDIFNVKGQPDETVKMVIECKSGSSAAPINLSFKIDPIQARFDINRTEPCVNEIVESFYSKELTGVGVGSSFLILLMMSGIAVMKRQLNQQKNINKELQQVQPVNAPAANGSPEGTSSSPVPSSSSTGTGNIQSV